MPDNQPKPAQQPQGDPNAVPSLGNQPDPSAGAPKAPEAKSARPVAARARAAAPAPTHYLVLHGAVGQWAQDRIVSAEELSGIDIDRLLRLGAIQPTQEPIKDVPPAADDAD